MKDIVKRISDGRLFVPYVPDDHNFYEDILSGGTWCFRGIEKRKYWFLPFFRYRYTKEIWHTKDGNSFEIIK